MQLFAKNCLEGLLVHTSASYVAAQLPSLAVLHGRIRARERVSMTQKRKFKETVPSIIRAIEERFRGRQQRTPEARRSMDRSATRRTTQTSSLPREQEEEEEEEDSRRWRKDEESGDCGSTVERRPATPNKDDRRAEIECRHTKKGTDTGIEDSHTPSHTAKIRGDSNAE